MPFIMTHLIIAKHLSDIYADQIKDIPQFYLGSAAPDAVHNRANYRSDYKKTSHLCVGEERWGYVTNNDEWEANIIAFMTNRIKSADRDFILGYCAHTLADLYNNVHSWTPFRLKYPDEAAKGYDNLHHRESDLVDIELGLTYPGREDFRRLLMASHSVDLPDIVFAEEIEKQKDLILYNWYADKKRPDVSRNMHVTCENMNELIKDATAYIVRIFNTVMGER